MRATKKRAVVSKAAQLSTCILHARHRCLVPLLCLLIVATGCTTQRRLAERGKRGFTQQGIASWYGPGFHGKLTANGETYDMYDLTAAHKQLPFDTVVEVINRDNGKSVRVRINDRGPFVRGRIIDLSRTAAEKIDMVGTGTANVTVRVVEAGSGRPYDASRSNTSKSSIWIVQAGAFRDQKRARQQLAAVRAVDRRARLESSGDLTRIVVGPFRREQEARSLLQELAKQRIDAIVVSGR